MDIFKCIIFVFTYWGCRADVDISIYHEGPEGPAQDVRLGGWTCRTILPVQNRGPYFQYFLSMCYHDYKILAGGRNWVYSLLFSEQYKAFHFLSDGQNSLFQFSLF